AATRCRLDQSRGRPVGDRLLGPACAGAVAPDCRGASRRLPCPQHRCIAHHLRALHKSRDKNPTEASPYLDAWERLWREVIELHRQRQALSAETFAQRRAALEATWDELLARPVTLAGDRYFLGRMRNTGSHHFGCLYHDVEPTNNRAERAIRPAAIAR